MTERPRPTLGQKLARAIDRFDPFEALRLLEDGDRGGGPPAVRGALTNRFVPTPLRRAADGSDAIEAVFVGLVGPLGPLPPFYTEAALRERKRRSRGLRDFLDLFVGRVVALFVRASEKYRLPPLVARHGPDGTGVITAALYALIGLGLPSLRGRLATPDSRLLPYAGLLIPEVRSAAGLQVLLADQLALPVRVEPLRQRWLPIEPHEQTRLDGAGAFNTLGVDAVGGARTLDVSSTFRVAVGPVDYGTFQWLAPGGAAMARVVDLVRVYADPGLDFDVQVILRKDDVPETRLGAPPPRLGWNSWVRQEPAVRDADQAVFDPGGG